MDMRALRVSEGAAVFDFLVIEVFVLCALLSNTLFLRLLL